MPTPHRRDRHLRSSNKEGTVSLPTLGSPGSSPSDIFDANGLEPLATDLPAATGQRPPMTTLSHRRWSRPVSMFLGTD
ncbi:hypothetical protein [Dactylosporangium darangshiense]|uniref:hypothetical protein n=1 Tax=Dactylosporangium darangshiense TaxID=579108 RepID=UPI0031EE734C